MEGVIATIMLFAGNFAPRNWAFCDGRLLAISQFQALFSIIGTTYGGDGKTTFALPDLRGRMPIGAGQGPGLNPVELGQHGGQEQTTLITSNLPSHTHAATLKNAAVRATSGTAASADPSGNALAVTDVTSRGIDITGNIYGSSPDTSMAEGTVVGDIEVGNTGGGQPIDNRSPYTAINYVICLEGVYPSRS